MKSKVESIPVPDDFRANARISSEEEYNRLYQESILDPVGFWDRLAESELDWVKPWKETLWYDPTAIGERAGGYLRWFSGGELNASYNCVDRHVSAGQGDRIAIHWQGDNEEEKRSLTYRELLTKVTKLANALKGLGARKGTAVTIYMPMVPEAAVAMLACARIGAMHSVVFSAFSSDALKSRIEDCKSQIVITADCSYHAGKVIALKHKVDEALAHCPTVKKVLVYDRSGERLQNTPMKEGRDYSWSETVETQPTDCPAEPFESETPLFALYTSGSTGKPKGVLHTTAGYLLFAHTTFKYTFDYQSEDIFFCTADVGWITGHSYSVYGPLSNCATIVMYEGVPTYPAADRFWKVIDHFKVTIFYTAPTAIRALMRLGEDIPDQFDFESLRLLGSVGEPINPEAWRWYHRVIGRERCPIVDTWWQTETGGILLTTLPGVHPMKPGSAGRPFFGVVPKIVVSEEGGAGAEDGGALFLEKPWPGMLRGVFGDEKAKLIKDTYFSRDPNLYFTGDGCRLDDDGYYTLQGRIDDVINVSAHRLAAAELESALVANPKVAEAAVVGFPHELKGQGIYCFVTLKSDVTQSPEILNELKQWVRKEIGPIATPDKIQFAPALPKTRSGKIMRRILRKIAEGQGDGIGDTSTLADPMVVEALLKGRVV